MRTAHRYNLQKTLFSECKVGHTPSPYNLRPVLFLISKKKVLAATYFPGTLRSEYLRRWSVSRLSSGWDQVVPLLYSRQAYSFTFVGTVPRE